MGRRRCKSGQSHAVPMTLSGKGIVTARQLWKVFWFDRKHRRGNLWTGSMGIETEAISQVCDRVYGYSFGVPVFVGNILNHQPVKGCRRRY